MSLCFNIEIFQRCIECQEQIPGVLYYNGQFAEAGCRIGGTSEALKAALKEATQRLGVEGEKRFGEPKKCEKCKGPLLQLVKELH